MSLRNKILILATAASLVPTAAWAEGAGVPHDLSLAEAKATFIKFSIGAEGSETQKTAHVYGMVYHECLDKFQITSTADDPRLTVNGVVGFAIRDLGGGVECQARLKGTRCSASNPCDRLSQREGATLELASFCDKDAAFIYADEQDDRQPIKTDPLDAPVRAVCPATLAAQRAAAASAERARLEKQYREQIASCRSSMNELEIANTALDGLTEIGSLDEDEIDRIRRELALAELGVINKKVDKVQADELDSLKEELSSWASDNPDESDRAASVYHTIALRETQAGTPESFDLATETLQEAKDTLDLSDRASYVLDNDLRDFKVAHCAAYAKEGSSAAMALYGGWNGMGGCFPQVMNDLMQQAQSCQSIEACSNIAASIRAASQIPMQARITDYNRCARNAQTQAMMAQAMGQNVNPQAQLATCGPAPQGANPAAIPGASPGMPPMGAGAPSIGTGMVPNMPPMGPGYGNGAMGGAPNMMASSMPPVGPMPLTQGAPGVGYSSLGAYGTMR